MNNARSAALLAKEHRMPDEPAEKIEIDLTPEERRSLIVEANRRRITVSDLLRERLGFGPLDEPLPPFKSSP